MAEPLSPLSPLLHYVNNIDNVEKLPNISLHIAARFQNISLFRTGFFFTAPIFNLCYKTNAKGFAQCVSTLLRRKYAKNLIGLIQDEACVLCCPLATTLRIKMTIGSHWFGVCLPWKNPVCPGITVGLIYSWETGGWELSRNSSPAGGAPSPEGPTYSVLLKKPQQGYDPLLLSS